MNIIEPNLNGEHLRIGIVQARFTNEVGSAMLKAAVEKLHELGVKDDNITVTTVGSTAGAAIDGRHATL